LEGPTMVRRTSDWRDELGRWLKPFLDRLGHKARRQMCPLYVSGLIGPGDRKSIQPMAKRLALGECDQLHQFIAGGVWDATPVETELLIQADRLVGGDDAVLVIDDTPLISVERALASEDPATWNDYFEQLYDDFAMAKTFVREALGVGALWTG